jgi:hypothetical protein
MLMVKNDTYLPSIGSYGSSCGLQLLLDWAFTGIVAKTITLETCSRCYGCLLD